MNYWIKNKIEKANMDLIYELNDLLKGRIIELIYVDPNQKM